MLPKGKNYRDSEKVIDRIKSSRQVNMLLTVSNRLASSQNAVDCIKSLRQVFTLARFSQNSCVRCTLLARCRINKTIQLSEPIIAGKVISSLSNIDEMESISDSHFTFHLLPVCVDNAHPCQHLTAAQMSTFHHLFTTCAVCYPLTS